jgi:hypothetical protein
MTYNVGEARARAYFLLLIAIPAFVGFCAGFGEEGFKIGVVLGLIMFLLSPIYIMSIGEPKPEDMVIKPWEERLASAFAALVVGGPIAVLAILGGYYLFGELASGSPRPEGLAGALFMIGLFIVNVFCLSLGRPKEEARA